MGKGRLSTARWGMLAVAALLATGLVALPAAAFAKTTTRIVVAAKTTVNNGTAGVTPWPVSMKATLQKKISGTHYHGMAGTVTLYRYNADTGKYVKQGSSKKAPSSGIVTFSITGDGKYKVYYSGSRTMKPATSYSEVFKTIGVTIARTAATITPIAGTTKYWVNVTYDVGWNTEAWAGDVILTFSGQHYDYDIVEDTFAEGASVYYSRNMKAPGAVEFNYKVEGSELMSHLYSYADTFVAADDYISTPTNTEMDEPTADLMP